MLVGWGVVDKLLLSKLRKLSVTRRLACRQRWRDASSARKGKWYIHWYACVCVCVSVAITSSHHWSSWALLCERDVEKIGLTFGDAITRWSVRYRDWVRCEEQHQQQQWHCRCEKAYIGRAQTQFEDWCAYTYTKYLHIFIYISVCGTNRGAFAVWSICVYLLLSPLRGDGARWKIFILPCVWALSSAGAA